MANSNGEKNAGMRAVAAVATIGLAIAGVYAMIEPMNQRIENSINEMREIRDEIKLLHDRDSQSLRDRATTGERFRETETQITNLGDRVERLENWHIRWEASQPEINAGVIERLKALERVVFLDKEII